MKLSPEEKQRHREAFRQMTGRQKLEHLWMYYKVPFLAALVCLILLGSTLRQVAAKKQPVLYLGQLNVAAGETLNQALDGGYLADSGGDPEKEQVFLYKNLYISQNASAENHEYAYASSMKLMAAINAKELDLVLMNREAYDLCSGSGYLLELSSLVPPSLSALLTENTVILEDNSLDVALNQGGPYQAVSRQETNGLRVNDLPMFASAGFPEDVYLGIIANTPRLTACTQYLRYLAEFG